MRTRSARCSAEHGAPAPASQAPLRLGQPGDAHEQEADRNAVAITAGRAASPPVAGGAPGIQASAVAARPVVPAALTRAAQATQTGGEPLSAVDRRFFEPRFDRDLSAIRIHTGPTAARAAQGINAAAYAHGTGIAFAPDRYRPDTPRGRRLLAHELVHTFQQGSTHTIRRTCPSDVAKIPPGDEADFEAVVDQITAHPRFAELPKIAKAKPNDPFAQEGPEVARDIIDGARASDCPMYYITGLKKLFDTVEVNRKDTAKGIRAKMTTRAQQEAFRINNPFDPMSAAMAGMEEAIAGEKSPLNWREETGKGGTTFLIDDTDPTQVFVFMKVMLQPIGGGAEIDVENTEALEDAIEKEAGTNGYLLNIDFVRTPGDDVFEVNVDPEEWPHSTNWVNNAGTLAHEAHHLLNLADRYDYIEVHAANEKMQIFHRLHLFRRQMVKSSDPLAGASAMEESKSRRKINEEDICAIARGQDFRGCLVARFAMRPATEIESVAHGLNNPYDPRSAALLHVLRDAWDQRPLKEQQAGCQKGDPLCGHPSESDFGDPNITGTDAQKHPLRNPHVEPDVSTLKKKARAKP